MNATELQVKKQILWEEAKGKLRAMVVTEGHRKLCYKTLSRDVEEDLRNYFLKIERTVEDFIAKIETEGMNE